MGINLLLWRETAKQKKLRELLLRCVLYVLLNILALYLIQVIFLHHIDNLQKDIININHAAQNMMIQKTAKNQEALLHKLITLYPKQKKMITRNKAMQQVLANIANNLPNTLTLSSLTITKKNIQVTGIGTLLSDIQTYSHALRRSGLHHVILSFIQKNQHTTNSFHFLIRATLCSDGK